ncbi:hypothetical protein BD414DRAFT_471805 [Trametes punicea]|nr:hypothetical protein BD414DRAFT_471805 [Trametes punicea]
MMPLACQALAPGGGLAIVLPGIIPADLEKEGDGKRIACACGNIYVPGSRACHGVKLYKRWTGGLAKGVKVRLSDKSCGFCAV